ncbi:fibronectin type III domain-containing protein [uncultured Microscilla sp.]|uniref:fibronectin type III domain-containing protein n=1 Tax=uncultured Microscilla sp. TaxID=432653 RepID=UPI00261E0A7E|nr:fibronectin type III domain-containing protein [uncultured Microscilla sp.]
MMLFNIKGLTMTFCLTYILCSCALFEKEFILPLPVAEEADQVNAVGFTARWKSVTGATGYEIDIALDENFGEILSDYKGKKVESNALIITNLEANTTYYYRVRAQISNQTSQSSNIIKVTTAELNTPIVYEASEVTATGFRVHWKKMPVAGTYLLDISTNSQFANFLPGFKDREAGNDTTFLVSNITVNTTYFYRIRIKQSESYSAYSNVQSVLTSTLPQPVTVAATNIQLTSFIANWKAMPEAVSYRIDVAKDALFQQILKGYNNTEVTTNSLVVANLDANTAYYYRVRAVNEESTSNHSNITIANTLNLDAPVATEATLIESGSFKAHWNPVNNAASYLLDVALDPAFSQILPAYNSVAIIGTELVVQSVDASTSYYYRVRAQGLNATSENSNAIKVTTDLLPAPVATAASGQKIFEFTANWQSQDGINLYLLDIATDAGFVNIVTGYNGKEVAGTSYKIQGLDFKATYFYRLRSKRLTKVSDYSNTIQVDACISNTCKVSRLQFFSNGTPITEEQTFTYNAQSQLISINYPKLPNAKNTVTYNGDGSIQKVVYTYNSSVIHTHTYTYSGGSLVSIKQYDGFGTFKEIWTFSYNAQNQRTSWSIYSDETLMNLTLRFDYTYDTKGNVVEVKNQGGTSIRQYQYDDKLSPYATIHPDLCFFVATNRDNWTTGSIHRDENEYRGFLPINNIKKEVISGTTTEVFIFNYNTKDLATSKEAFYSAIYTMTGCSF